VLYLNNKDMRSKVLKPIGIFLVILALLVGLIFFVVQSSFFKQFLRVTTNAIVSSLTNQGFIIGSIEGDFLRGIILRDVSFEIEGEAFIESDEIFIDYSLPLLLDSSMLFSKVIPLDEVSITGLQIHLVHNEDRTWNFEKLGAWEQEKDPQESPQWNVFIQKAILTQAKIRIDDRVKKEVTHLKSDKIDLTIKMFKIDERIEIELRKSNLGILFQDMDNDILYLDDISGGATYTKGKGIDKFDVKRLDFYSGDAEIRVKGFATNLKHPEFTLNATAENFLLDKSIGNINMELVANGDYENYQYLRANGKLKLTNSTLRGEGLQGAIDVINVDGSKIVLKGGTLNTDFGSASFAGKLDLEEMLAEGTNNKLDINFTIDSLQASRVFEMVEKSEAFKENVVLEERVNSILDANLNAAFNIRGDWNKRQDLQAQIDLASLSLTGSDIGELRVSGPLQITGSKVDYDLNTSFVKTDLAFLLKDEHYRSSINSNLQLKGSVLLQGDFLDGFQGSIQGEILPSTLSGLDIKQGEVKASYNERVLKIQSLYVDSDSLTLKASGSFSNEGSKGIKYDADIRDLSVLSNFIDDFDVKGFLKLSGSIKGDFNRPRIILSARGSDFTNGKESFVIKEVDISADTFFSYEDPGLHVKGAVRGAEINGKRIKSANFQADSKGEMIDGSLNILGAFNSRYKMDFRLTELNEYETKLEISNINLNFQKEVLKNRTPVLLSVFKDKISISSFNLYHKDNYIIGAADLGFDGGLNGSLELKKLNLEDVSQLLNLFFPLKGQLTGKIDLDTSLKYPDIKTDISAKNLEFMNFKSDELLLNLLVSKSGVDFNLNVSDKSKKILTASGKANIDLSSPDLLDSYKKGTIDMSIQSDGVDISPLAAFNPELEKIDGKLKIDVSAFGTGDNPNVSGKVEVEDVKFKVYSLRNEIEIPYAVMDLDGDYGILKPAIINTGEGEGVFEGRVDLRDLSYTGKGTMKGLLVKTNPDDVTANLDGELDVKGQGFKAFIDGNVIARNVKAIVPEKPVKYIENIHFVDDRNIQAEVFIFTGKGPVDYFIEYIAMDIDVDVPNNSWVKGSGASIEVKGKLKVKKNYGEMYVVGGNIDVVRGDYHFLGKRFNIESGTVSFRGKKVVNPFLDVTALYEVSSIQIFINITGTAEKPKIQLTSDPPLDENEIVSYLVFGTSSENLSTDSRVSFQEKAGEVLGTMAVGELRDMLGEEFALDVITIKGGQAGFGDTHVELGKHITQDLYVGYERFSYERFYYERYFFSPGLPSSTVTANRAVIEYRLFDFLTVESDIGEESGADLFFNFDY
jgi:autotransporter translocation and assembly factor TamB